MSLLQFELFPPDSSWTPPSTYPDLTTEKLISLDMETRDPRLKTRGPGFPTLDGEVTGIALATGDSSWYFPVAHFGGGNLDRNITIKWLKDQFKHFNGTLTLANAQYDLGWLATLGIKPNCEVMDIQVIEALLDEERPSYSLDSLARDYLRLTKEENLLLEAAATYRVDPKAEMWKLPARFVGPYAEQDARITYDIYQKQLPKIQEEGIESILRIESGVTPILLGMARRGVRVDVRAAERLNEEWLKTENDLLKKIGIGPEDLWTNGFLIDLFKKKGLRTPMTAPTKTYPDGQPSFNKEFIRGHSDPDVRMVGEVRELSRLRDLFVRKRILEGHIRGRVYPHYIQLSSDEGGTRTGRLAGKYHNKQQIPKRSKFVDARRIRALYLPEQGERWLSADYDAQEPRLQIHYGMLLKLRGSREAAEYVAQGKKLYHLVQDAAGCDYNQAKTLTLGLSYGMGIAKLAASLGVSPEKARREILDPLNNNCPFMQQFAQAASTRAAKKGYVRTILGRKKRFKLWQSRNYWDYKKQAEHKKNLGEVDEEYWDLIQKCRARPRDKAEEFFGSKEPLERAYTHKAGNAIIQGSAADQTKAAMVALHELGYTLISQVHDEINVSISSEKDIDIIKNTMEHTTPLEIDSKADCELSKTWAGDGY